MLYFLIGIVLLLLFIWGLDRGYTVVVICVMVVVEVVLLFDFPSFPYAEKFEYRTQTPQTYQLQELRENQYYSMNAKGNSISALIIDTNGFYIKHTFNVKKVKFQEGEKAEITITKEKTKKQSQLDSILFLPNKKSGKERVKNVVIKVPKDSYITAEQTKEPLLAAQGCGGFME